MGYGMTSLTILTLLTSSLSGCTVDATTTTTGIVRCSHGGVTYRYNPQSKYTDLRMGILSPSTVKARDVDTGDIFEISTDTPWDCAPET